MSDKAAIITIDGPAGAGKSTIAKVLAERIGYRYVDTGAMYRAITLVTLEENIDFSDILGIEKITENTSITIDFIDDEMRIYVNGEDVSDKIRNASVTENTSRIAAIPAVRYKLAKIQRETAEKLKHVVFEGRDMGSIVFPNADYKIYLDAGISMRAHRRWQELKDKGEAVNIEELKQKIQERDKKDASRGLAPLRIPDNAIIIDSTKLTIDEVIDQIITIIK
ncbi:(d)CMP kinase [Elusimicrobiota bacterium]